MIQAEVACTVMSLAMSAVIGLSGTVKWWENGVHFVLLVIVT